MGPRSVFGTAHKAGCWYLGVNYNASDHQPHNCLLNHLFRHRAKKTWKLHITGVGNSPITRARSRNDPLAIGSDTILWSWWADRIPQTPITIGSSDRENTKPNSLLPIESRHKSFTGKYRIEITWSWLNKKCQTDDIYSWRHNVGGVATSFISADTRASWPVQCTHTLFAHDTTRFGHAIFNRYVYVINVIESIQTVDTRQAMFQ